MEYEIYKKLELHKTLNLPQDIEFIKFKQEELEKLLTQNNIEYVFELREHYSQYCESIIYFLDLIIKEKDLEKTEELFYKEGISYIVIDTIKQEKEKNSENPSDDEILNSYEEEQIDGIRNSKKDFGWLFIIIIVLIILIYMYK